jgi:protein-disulfide isomerase
VVAGTEAGVTVTPTFFVNGAVLVGEQSLADFERAIDRELARTASRR